MQLLAGIQPAVLLQKKLKQWFLKPYNMERLTMNFYQ